MRRPCVLVFAGSDPSGGAGISADIEAIAAQGAHALPVITAITVQDNDQVLAVHPVEAQLILRQAQVLTDKITIGAIKTGIIASRVNAQTIAAWINGFKQRYPDLPVIVDPVLASGCGDALAVDDALDTIAPLLRVATLITPNLPEAAKLCPNAAGITEQAKQFMRYGAADILIKGGHGEEACVTNHWFHHDQHQTWQSPRLPGAFHGSGCTLASAIAAQLAGGQPMQAALEAAQSYCHRALQQAYAIAAGQLIPQRH